MKYNGTHKFNNISTTVPITVDSFNSVGACINTTPTMSGNLKKSTTRSKSLSVYIGYDSAKTRRHALRK